ncbi:DNA polymerase III subunit gamma/tau [Patescibacteria group bacterium]
MFYTKYRPQKFSEAIKTSEAVDALPKQLKGKKTVHAYLFIGPRGTGKTTVARLLAKTLNCTSPLKNGDPCNRCKNCKSINLASFTDLIEIDAASNRGIDDVRDLRDKIRLAPSMGKHKIYIVDEVHMLTTEAFNALLKTLEEPPQNVTFILCTTEDHKVPATIKSRCQIFRFKRATVKQIVSKLKKIVKEEKIDIKDGDLSKIAEASLGGFRDAETLLQQVFEGEVDIGALLSVSSKEKYIECVDNLLDCNAKGALSIVESVFEEGVDLYIWVGELLKYMRGVLFIKSGAKGEAMDVTKDLMKKIEEQAEKVDLKWLVSSVNLLVDSHQKIKNSFIPQLPVELAIVEICFHGCPAPEGALESFDDTPPSSPIVGTTTKVIKETVMVVKEKVTPKARKPFPKSNVELSTVKKRWKKFVEKSKDLNHSLTALLRSSTPVNIENNFIVLEVFYPFHKERLESPRHRKLLEDLSEMVYGSSFGVRCVVSDKKPPKRLMKGESGILTDLNVTPVSIDKEAVLEALDGGLPMMGKS